MGSKHQILLLSISLLFGVAVGGLWPSVIHIRDNTRAMADAHRKHETAHKGWSFPAKVWSNSASIDLPPEQLMEHARLRDYVQACPARDPGEYCPKTGTVIPRGGVFPEGKQPGGLAGWIGGADWQGGLAGRIGEDLGELAASIFVKKNLA